LHPWQEAFDSTGPGEPERTPGARTDRIAPVSKGEGRGARAPHDATPDERLGLFYDRTSARVYGLLLRILGDARKSEQLLIEIYVETAPRLLRMAEPRATVELFIEARRRALQERAVNRAAAKTPAPEAALAASGAAAVARLEGVDRECSSWHTSAGSHRARSRPAWAWMKNR
jgi:hypothetical protein